MATSQISHIVSKNYFAKSYDSLVFIKNSNEKVYNERIRERDESGAEKEDIEFYSRTTAQNSLVDNKNNISIISRHLYNNK